MVEEQDMDWRTDLVLPGIVGASLPAEVALLAIVAEVDIPEQDTVEDIVVDL